MHIQYSSMNVPRNETVSSRFRCIGITCFIILLLIDAALCFTIKGDWTARKFSSFRLSSTKSRPEEPINRKMSYYEILGAAPTATRAELKAQYVKLAKLSHPDAQIGKDLSLTKGTAPDFGLIAEAWRVLGDEKSRRKYDRTLKAEAFSASAQLLVNERLEEAVPAVAKIMDKVAVPFLRRTTATTWAVAQAAAQGVSNMMPNEQVGVEKKSPNGSIGRTFWDAVEAGQRAGKAIDSIELREKTSELEQRTRAEIDRAKQIDAELSAVTKKRLWSTLQSSDFALSSAEAWRVLEYIVADPRYNSTSSSPSLMDRAMLRRSIEEEITELRDAEVKFSEGLNVFEETDVRWKQILQEQAAMRESLAQSKRDEIKARKALADAQRRVAEAKATLVVTSNALRDVEEKVKRNAMEMDKITAQLGKRQDRVRSQLRKKTESAMDPAEISEFSQLSADELKALREKELKLISERAQIEEMVERLQSRAEKLSSRANALEKFERTGRKDSMQS